MTIDIFKHNVYNSDALMAILNIGNEVVIISIHFKSILLICLKLIFNENKCCMTYKL